MFSPPLKGKYAEAEGEYEQCQASKEEYLGSDHPKLAASLNEWALVLTKQARAVVNLGTLVAVSCRYCTRESSGAGSLYKQVRANRIFHETAVSALLICVVYSRVLYISLVRALSVISQISSSPHAGEPLLLVTSAVRRG